MDLDPLSSLDSENAEKRKKKQQPHVSAIILVLRLSHPLKLLKNCVMISVNH